MKDPRIWDNPPTYPQDIADNRRYPPSKCDVIAPHRVGIRLDPNGTLTHKGPTWFPMRGAKHLEGSKGNMVRTDPIRRFNATTAPATVSGARPSYATEEHILGKATEATTASQETCHV